MSRAASAPAVRKPQTLRQPLKPEQLVVNLLQSPYCSSHPKTSKQKALYKAKTKRSPSRKKPLSQFGVGCIQKDLSRDIVCQSLARVVARNRLLLEATKVRVEAARSSAQLWRQKEPEEEEEEYEDFHETQAEGIEVERSTTELLDYMLIKDSGFRKLLRHRQLQLVNGIFSSSCSDSYVVFDYPNFLQLTRPPPEHWVSMRHRLVSASASVPVRFLISSTSDYNAIVFVAKWAGLKRATSMAKCNLFFGKHLNPSDYEALSPLVRVNHFPGSWAMGRKDKLAYYLTRLEHLYGNDVYDFLPQTFILPRQREEFERATHEQRGTIWIMKPVASSCGKGIKLIESKGQVGAKAKCVISKYIASPLLINSRKFDLRVYVVITCIDPLRIYMLDDGLVRFATRPYSTSKRFLSQKYIHVTNFSIQRHSPSFVQDSSASNGSKWSLQALWHYLEKQGRDVKAIEKQIEQIIIKTIIGVEPVMRAKMYRYHCRRTSCFELLGFDILLDSAWKAWLLEVNVQPSLSFSSPLDKAMKTKLIADMLNLLHLQAKVGSKDTVRAAKQAERRKLKRVIGLGRDALETQPKSISNLMKLNLSKETLTTEDRKILQETEMEYQTKGHFKRIYPTKERCIEYAKLFEETQYNNLLVAKWLQFPREQAIDLLFDCDESEKEQERN